MADLDSRSGFAVRLFLGKQLNSTDALTAGCGVSYFVQCKSFQQEMMIDWDAPGADAVTITGDFN